ncbi:MAG TPA: hypothetical protein IAD08_04460 [Candidatus Scatovivens faecipullorum]|nr:hypothetical protein [Candidatus Scatovivens faecipullorum]
MVVTNNIIKMNLINYSNQNTKIAREVKNGKYFKIINGLYETDASTPGYLLAGCIYGPSYLSFDFALAYYDLIPERVVNYTCATFNKKKKKEYHTNFGNFFYRDVPKEVYPYGINLIKESEYYYQIATPEKALCDKLYTIPPLANIQDIRTLLIDDLRIDKSDLKKLNYNDIEKLEELYHSTNVTLLKKYLRRIKDE